MNLLLFKESLSANKPPEPISVYIQALWYDAKNEWAKAHELIQGIEDDKAAWIHAYLHRKEGDIANADYWYKNAGKKRPLVSIENEWEEIVSALV